MSLWMPALCICHTCASVTNPPCNNSRRKVVDGFDGVTFVCPKTVRRRSSRWSWCSAKRVLSTNHSDLFI